MPTSNAVQPGQSLNATRSGAFAGAGGSAETAALALALACALGALADAESGVSLLQPTSAQTNAKETKALTIREVWPARSFDGVSDGLRVVWTARLRAYLPSLVARR